MSHTTVYAGKVLAACDRYLKQREELIEKRCAEMVEEARRPLWRRLLRLEPISEELARRRLAGDTFSPYNMIWMMAGRDAGRVQELRSLAMAAQRSGTLQVTLSEEHAHILETYWE